MAAYGKILLLPLLVVALSWQFLVGMGLSMSTSLWYVAWTAIGLGIALAVVLGMLEVLDPRSGTETDEAAGIWVVPVLFLVVPAVGIVLLLWLFVLTPEEVHKVKNVAIRYVTIGSAVSVFVWVIFYWIRYVYRLIHRGKPPEV